MEKYIVIRTTDSKPMSIPASRHVAIGIKEYLERVTDDQYDLVQSVTVEQVADGATFDFVVEV